MKIYPWYICIPNSRSRNKTGWDYFAGQNAEKLIQNALLFCQPVVSVFVILHCIPSIFYAYFDQLVLLECQRRGSYFSMLKPYFKSISNSCNLALLSKTFFVKKAFNECGAGPCENTVNVTGSKAQLSAQKERKFVYEWELTLGQVWNSGQKYQGSSKVHSVMCSL